MTSRKKSVPAARTISPEEAPKAPAPEVEKVDCPPELGVAARQEWDRIATHLVAAGRLTAVRWRFIALLMPLGSKPRSLCKLTAP